MFLDHENQHLILDSWISCFSVSAVGKPISVMETERYARLHVTYCLLCLRKIMPKLSYLNTLGNLLDGAQICNLCFYFIMVKISLSVLVSGFISVSTTSTIWPWYCQYYSVHIILGTSQNPIRYCRNITKLADIWNHVLHILSLWNLAFWNFLYLLSFSVSQCAPVSYR